MEPETVKFEKSKLDQQTFNKKFLFITVLLILFIIIILGIIFFLVFSKLQDNNIDNNTDNESIITNQCDYENETYQDGDKFPDKDGCNTCTCTNGEIACTEIYCYEEENEEQEEQNAENNDLTDYYMEELDLTISLPSDWIFENYSKTNEYNDYLSENLKQLYHSNTIVVPDYYIKNLESGIGIKIVTSIETGWCEGVGYNNPYKCVETYKNFNIKGEQITCYAAINTHKDNDEPKPNDFVEIAICPEPDFDNSVIGRELTTGDQSIWKTYELLISGSDFTLSYFESDAIKNILESIK